ncbi:MAG: hypothetical protein DRP57_03825 [Spirochaetes bacterium]|nr:MAG: hypothetical protein DRP57_03825 [Spirochaetota bacterium]
MLEKEYKYFLSIRDKLVKEHPNEYVVIRDENILGFYPSEEDALKNMSNYELGTFLVQECIPEDHNIHRHHSRVVFA